MYDDGVSPLLRAFAAPWLLAVVGCAGGGWLGKVSEPDDSYPPPCEAKSVAKCRSACNAGDGPACVALARAFEVEHGSLVANPAKSKELRMKACTDGYARGCTDAAHRLDDDDDYLTLMERACTLGFGHGCLAAGVARGRRGAPTHDFASAVELFRMGCDRGSAGSCLAFAEAHRIGIVAGPGEKEARERMCRVSTASACDPNPGHSALLLMARRYDPDPPYWALLEAQRSAGVNRVKGEICVRADGSTFGIHLVESSGSLEFDGVILDTLQSWTFHSLVDGSKEELGCLTMTFDIRFETKPETEPDDDDE